MAKAPSTPRATPPAPASASSTASNGAESELSAFVRDAIREKAARELAALDARAQAMVAATKARTDAVALLESVMRASPVLTASADVTAGVPAKLKRMKKSLEEAISIADQLVEAVGGEGDRAEEVGARRAEIEKALAAAGIAREELQEKKPAPTESEPEAEAASEPIAEN